MNIEEFRNQRAKFIEALRDRRDKLIKELKVIESELTELGGKKRGRKPGTKVAKTRKRETGKRLGRPPKAFPDAQK